MSPQRARRRRQRIKWAVMALVIVICAAGTGLGTYLYLKNAQTEELQEQTEEVQILAEEVKHFQQELQNALVRNCQRNGNPLRAVLQKRIHREINQSEDYPLFEKLFPNLTHKELRHLVERSTRNLHQEVREVAPVNCNKIYPR